MYKLLKILPFVSLATLIACAPLDNNEQKVQVSIPIQQFGEVEKASSQSIPSSSKIFVV